MEGMDVDEEPCGVPRPTRAARSGELMTRFLTVALAAALISSPAAAGIVFNYEQIGSTSVSDCPPQFPAPPLCIIIDATGIANDIPDVIPGQWLVTLHGQVLFFQGSGNFHSTTYRPVTTTSSVLDQRALPARSVWGRGHHIPVDCNRWNWHFRRSVRLRHVNGRRRDCASRVRSARYAHLRRGVSRGAARSWLLLRSWPLRDLGTGDTGAPAGGPRRRVMAPRPSAQRLTLPSA